MNQTAPDLNGASGYRRLKTAKRASWLAATRPIPFCWQERQTGKLFVLRESFGDRVLLSNEDKTELCCILTKHLDRRFTPVGPLKEQPRPESFVCDETS